MFIAMNRFRVIKENIEDFEQLWIARETFLHEMAGFIAFHLLKGPEREDHQLYASHTVWRSQADFKAWTESDAFSKAHAKAGERKVPIIGGAEFEGFNVVQEVKPDGSMVLHAAE